jgi:Cu2+-exporting ATPase
MIMDTHFDHSSHPTPAEPVIDPPHDHASMGHGGSVHGGAHHGADHEGHADHAGMVEDFKRRFWISLALTIPVVLLSPMLQMWAGLGERLRFAGDAWVLFALSSVIYFYGGHPFLKGLVDELGAKRPGMMTLVAVAITTAYLYSSAVVFGLAGEGFFWELATLIDLMLVGHWIEMRSIMGASRALEALARLVPSEAHRIDPDGSVIDLPIERLVPGDRILVKPAEKIPADGVVIEGTTSVNESMLTGESVPVTKREQSEVIGGSVNGEGSITVEVRRVGADSFLSQVIRLVEEAQQSRSRTQDLASRAALWLTIVAIVGGIVTFLGWFVFAERTLAFAIERAVTVMVISCPHALGLAVPLVVAVSTSLAAGTGLLIRDRAAFENSRNVQAVIFDKTGTLTEGAFGITDTISFIDGVSSEEILRLAAAVESRSQHPIATGIVAAVAKPPEVADFQAITGRGAMGMVEGRQVKVVSPGYLRDGGVSVPDPRADELRATGKTVVFVVVDGVVMGAIALADIVRAESRDAIARLKEMGIRSMMLTGDNAQVAASVSQQIGLDEYFAEVLPHQKSEKVKEVQSRGLVVAMTGDGVNDAPALAQADVGIAVGAGTDVAIEAADVILVRSNPRDVVAAIDLARATYRKMIQNLWWAAGYNIVAIPLAAGVLAGAGIILSPAVGAVLMSASTVIVAINARLLRVDRRQVFPATQIKHDNGHVLRGP